MKVFLIALALVITSVAGYLVGTQTSKFEGKTAKQIAQEISNENGKQTKIDLCIEDVKKNYIEALGLRMQSSDEKLTSAEQEKMLENINRDKEFCVKRYQ